MSASPQRRPRLHAALRDGSWVTLPRMRVYCALLLVVTVISYGAMVATSHAGRDTQGRPLGTDFSDIYAAGTYVRDGRPQAPFDAQQQMQREQEIFGAATPFYGWHYPPFFLPVAGLLAALPYLAALLTWLGATLIFYLRGLRRLIAMPRLWLPALAFPAVFVNLGHGQNGFLTAGLLSYALALLAPSPWLAGVCFGLLAYKPQFGLLIPLALLAGGHWRSFAAAALTVLAMAALVTLLYGAGVWHAFFAALPFTRHVVLEQGGTGFYKLQSSFAAVRLWGGSVALAYLAQAVVALTCALTLVRLWRSDASMERKGAALVLACLLATPYSLDYDLMALAPALVLLARQGSREGFAPYEKTLLALLFFCPMVTRAAAEYASLPLALLLMLALYGQILSSGTAVRSA